jgi:peptide/nickel transport system permease protein
MRRFLRNRPAVAGSILLLLMTLASAFAYLIAPDGTHQCNFRVEELPRLPPGARAQVLLQPTLADAGESPGFLGRLLRGTPDRYKAIPLDGAGVTFANDTLHYGDLQGERASALLPEFLLPLDRYHQDAIRWKDEGGRPYALHGDEISYRDLGGQLRTASLGSLRLQVQVTELSFPLGTDGAGRDVLSRLLLGGRVSLGVGFLAVLVSLLLGVFFGAVAGFFRGFADQAVMWFVSVVWSLPTLLLAISISFVLGKGFEPLFIAIGVSTWVEVARIVRGQIFTLREMQFVEATRALGFRAPRAIVRHVLPNVLSPVIIVSAANFASAILLEAGLSFLGVGVQAPAPSWGGMIQEGYTQIYFDSGLWLAIIPGLAIVLVVISLHWIGQGLRDALDPRYISA